MNRTLFAVVAALAMGLSITFARHASAQNCASRPGSGESVAWAWGDNLDGQLGDGTTTGRLIPVQVQNLSGLQTVVAGGFHVLALKSDCTVWAWGSNSNGQLGNGTMNGTANVMPVQVQNLEGITKIAAGFLHSLALRGDGTVWAWGWNGFGQLGDGTFNDSNVPVQVQNLKGVIAIAAGGDHCLALRSDGTVWAWGENFSGELGDGTTDHRNVPVEVQNLGGVKAVAIGAMHSLAVRGNVGTVYAWGQNNVGQLGDGTTTDRHTPVQVLTEPLVLHPEAAGRIVAPGSFLTGVTAVAAGSSVSLALKGDGSIWAWGSNVVGSLGDGTLGNDRLTAGPVPHVNGVIAIATSSQGLAVRRNAIVQAWGSNLSGELGDDTTITKPYAVQVENLVENLSAVTAVSAGTEFSIVAGIPLTQLTVTETVVNPNSSHQRLFNLLIDGTVVLPNIEGGSTGPLTESPGNHTVSETEGAETPPSSFDTVIGGACAVDGTVNLAFGDRKTCTITNFDHTGGCASGSFCCEPGTGMQPCAVCSRVGHECK